VRAERARALAVAGRAVLTAAGGAATAVASFRHQADDQSR
jgi:hypothetical protein